MTEQRSSSAVPRLAAFGPRLAGALSLRRDFYAGVAADPRSWRPATAVVCLAALAQDSLGYTELDLFLALLLGYWVLLPVMAIAMMRWVLATAVALPIAALLAGGSVQYGRLLRSLGFAHAPALLYAIPALLYVLGVEVDGGLLRWVRWIVTPWLVATMTVAASVAIKITAGRALIIGLLVLLIGTLFDQILDLALLETLRSLGQQPDTALPRPAPAMRW